jgi:uracil-DNA glycosylase
VHESGIPFDDPSGDRLRDWMGVDRDVFYDPTKIAILPMAFCYPGTGKSGDLPPPPRCAEAWRQELLATLTDTALTIVIGRYARDWHMPERAGESLTDTIADWQALWPDLLPAPHPSPRNNRWLKRNPWFAEEVLPMLRDRVHSVLSKGIR